MLASRQLLENTRSTNRNIVPWSQSTNQNKCNFNDAYNKKKIECTTDMFDYLKLSVCKYLVCGCMP